MTIYCKAYISISKDRGGLDGYFSLGEYLLHSAPLLSLFPFDEWRTRDRKKKIIPFKSRRWE